MITLKVKLNCPDHIHLRPATQVSLLAEQCNCEIWIRRLDNRKKCDAKSIYGLTHLDLRHNAELEIGTTDPAGKEILDQLKTLIESGDLNVIREAAK